jgi:integrase
MKIGMPAAGIITPSPWRAEGEPAMKIRRKRLVRIDKRTREALETQREAFRIKFGREPGPGDPLFFDPNADEPRPLEAEGVAAEVVKAMEEAGIHPRLVHAFRRTGLLVTEENIDRLGPRELAEWKAALEEYDDLIGLSS